MYGKLDSHTEALSVLVVLALMVKCIVSTDEQPLVLE